MIVLGVAILDSFRSLLFRIFSTTKSHPDKAMCSTEGLTIIGFNFSPKLS